MSAHPQPLAALAGRGEDVVVNRGFIVGPHVPTQIVLRQPAEEKRQIDEDRENLAEAPSTHSGVLAEAPPPADAAAAQVINELEQVLCPCHSPALP